MLRRLAGLLVALSLLATLVLVGYWAMRPGAAPSWTGFGAYPVSPTEQHAKTLWDWLDLLIVPLFIAVAAWFLSTAQKSAEQQAQGDQQRQKALEEYFGRMGALLLERGLRAAGLEAEPRILARTWTLALFRTLDGGRKGEALQFLYESDLIDRNPLLDLNGASLETSELSHATLRGVEMRGVYLRNACFREANLEDACLVGSDLAGADLRRAILVSSDLSWAVLRRANLRFTDLSEAQLKGADLSGAQLWGAKISAEQRDVIAITRPQSVFLDIMSFFRRLRLAKTRN